MTRTILDLAKPKTTVFDLSNVLNPRVNDDLAKISFHIQYDNKPFNMTGYKMYFISADENMGYINVDGMVDKVEYGDNVGNGDITFKFPANVFKKAGTFDSSKTMFVVENVNSNYIQSTINVSLTVLENGIAKFNADVDQIGYDSKLEEIHNKYKDKAQNLIDELINQVKAVDNFSNVKETAEQAKQVANDSIAKANAVNIEVTTARSRFSNLNDRLNNQDIKINSAETAVNASQNYSRLDLKNQQQDSVITTKADKYELENKLSQMKLYPESFENADAIKKTYPDGKPGIFVAVDTGHQWYWINGTWKDAGAYQTPAPIDDIRNVEAELNSALEGHGLQNLLSLKKSYWGNSQLKADGTWEKGDYWLSSAFTAIKPLHYYSVSTASGYRFMLNVYDKNKAFLYSTQHYTSSNPYTFIADKNAAYVIVCVNASGAKMTQDDLPALKARLYECDKFTNDEFTYGTTSSGKSVQSSVRVVSDYIKLDYNSDYRIESLYNIEVACYDRDKNYLPNNLIGYFTGSKQLYTGYGVRYIRFIAKKTNTDGTDIPMFDFGDVAPQITKLANNYIPRQLASLVWHVGGFNSDGSEKLGSSRMRSDPIRVNSNTAYDISKPAAGYIVGVMLYDLDMNYITAYDYRSDKMTVEGFDGFIRLYLKKTTDDEFSSDSDGYAANITVTELNSDYLALGKSGISLRIATNNVGSFGMGVQAGFSSNQHENMTLDQLSQNWLKYTSGIDILAMQEFSTYLDQAKTVSMRERLMNNFSVLKTGINNEALALKDGRLIDYKVGNLNGTQGWDTSGVRGYIKGTMRLNNGQNLSLYVVHFTPSGSDNSSQRRNEQKANLLKMLADDPSFIVFGDFNTPADDPMWKDFAGKYRVVNGTYLGTFGTYIYGDTSIDNIITSNNIVVKSAQVNPITDDNWVSTDHRMLIADVVVGESY